MNDQNCVRGLVMSIALEQVSRFTCSALSDACASSVSVTTSSRLSASTVSEASWSLVRPELILSASSPISALLLRYTVLYELRKDRYDLGVT